VAAGADCRMYLRRTNGDEMAWSNDLLSSVERVMSTSEKVIMYDFMHPGTVLYVLR
jgi:hypothetical protein